MGSYNRNFDLEKLGASSSLPKKSYEDYFNQNRESLETHQESPNIAKYKRYIQELKKEMQEKIIQLTNAALARNEEQMKAYRKKASQEMKARTKEAIQKMTTYDEESRQTVIAFQEESNQRIIAYQEESNQRIEKAEKQLLSSFSKAWESLRLVKESEWGCPFLVLFEHIGAFFKYLLHFPYHVFLSVKNFILS